MLTVSACFDHLNVQFPPPCSGVLLSLSKYTGAFSDLYQSCLSANFTNTGRASYLAGFSTDAKGDLVYNELGELQRIGFSHSFQVP